MLTLNLWGTFKLNLSWKNWKRNQNESHTQYTCRHDCLNSITLSSKSPNVHETFFTDIHSIHKVLFMIADKTMIIAQFLINLHFFSMKKYCSTEPPKQNTIEFMQIVFFVIKRCFSKESLYYLGFFAILGRAGTLCEHFIVTAFMHRTVTCWNWKDTMNWRIVISTEWVLCKPRTSNWYQNCIRQLHVITFSRDGLKEDEW